MASERYTNLKNKILGQSNMPAVVSPDIDGNGDTTATGRSSRYEALKKKVVGQLDQSYIDTFAKDAEAYKTQAKKDFSALDWNAATSEEAKVSRAQQVADLNSRSRRIRSYLDTYKDELSPEGYESLMGYLDDFDSFSADSTRDFRKKSDEIARFASAQEYEEFLTSQKAESELYGYDLSSGEKEIAALRSQLDSLDWTSNTDRARAKAINEEIAAKEKYLEKARKAQQMQQRKQTYASLMAAEDFQSLSQYSPKAEKSATLAQWNSLSDEEQDSYFDAVSGLSQEDLLCEAVNGNFAAAVGLNNAGHEVFDGLDEIYRKTPSELLQLSGEERAVFNYLYRKQGLPAAKKFLNDMAEDLSVRQKSAVTKAAQERANAQPLLASLDTVVTGPFQGLIGSMGVVSDLADGDGLQTNGDYMNLSNESAAVRGAVADKIATETPLGKVGAFGYNIGMSMADSAARLAISAGNPEMSAFLAGSNAAVSTISSAKERGLSDSQAIGMGVIAGAAEVICERVSLGVLLDTDAIKDGALKYVIKNALAEGSEEVNTDLVNTVADILIAQDESEWQKAIDAYKEEGYDPNEAFARAFGDKAIEIGLSGLSGAISGGLMSGGTAAMHTVAANQQASQLFGDKSSALLQAALDVDPNNKYARKMLSKLEDGKTLTGNELRKLSEIVADARTSAAVDGLMQGIEPTQKVTPRVPTGSERLVSEMMDEVMPPKEKTPLEAALNAYRETGSVSNRQAEAVLNDPVALKTVLDATGTVLPDTASGKRAAVKEAIAELHQQQEQSIAVDNPADIAYDETGMTSPTTYGGYDYGAAVQAEPSASDRSGQAEILERQGGASAQDGNRPGVPHTESVGAAPAGFTGKQGYYDLLTDDNVQPARKTDVRPVEIPKTDGKGRKVSEFAHNAAGAQVTPDSAVDTIEDLVVEEALSFDTVTNRAMMENAQEYIKKNGGPKKTARDIGKRVFNGKVSGKDITAAQLLYAHYVNKPDAASQETAQELLVDLATMANETGRNLQLYAMFRKLTPEGQLAVRLSLAEHMGEQAQKKSKKKVTVTVSEKTQQDFKDVSTTGETVVTDAAEALRQAQAADVSAAANAAIAAGERAGRDAAKSAKNADNIPVPTSEQQLYEVIMEFINSKKQNKIGSAAKERRNKALTALQQYYANRDQFSEAWHAAQRRAEAELSGDDKAYGILRQFLDTGGMAQDVMDTQDSGSVSRKAIREAANAADVKLSELVSASLQDKTAALQKIQDYVSEHYDMEPEAAQQFSQQLQDAFFEELADRQTRRLFAMFGQKDTANVPKVRDQFRELYNTGAFTRQPFVNRETRSALISREALKQVFGQDGLTLSEEVLEQYGQISDARKAAVDQRIAQEIADQIPTDLRSVLNKWRYTAMLANPSTHFKNITGSAAQSLIQHGMKDNLAALIEAGVDKVSGGKLGRTKAALNLLSKKDWGLLNLAWNDYGNLWRNDGEVAKRIKNGGRYDDMRSAVEENRRIFKLNNPQGAVGQAINTGLGFVETASNLNSELLDAEDAFFGRNSYTLALAMYMKANGLTEITEDARAYAIAQAQECTFHDCSLIYEKVKWVKSTAVGDITVPYVKTPANVTSRAVEYSPAGLLNAIRDIILMVKQSDQIDVENRITGAKTIDDLSKGLIGSALWGIGALLAASGVIRIVGTGSEEKRKYEQMMGYKNFTICIGDTYIDGSFLNPAILPIFSGAAVYEMWQSFSDGEASFTDVLNAIYSVADPILSSSMMSSLDGFMYAIRSMDNPSTGELAGTIIQELFETYAAQFFPSFIRRIAAASDNTSRQTYADPNNPFSSFIQNTQSGIPGLRDDLKAKYDIWGQEIKQDAVDGKDPLSWMWRVITPSRVADTHATPIDDELVRLMEAGFDATPTASNSKTITVNGERIRLDADQYAAYEKVEGQTAYKLAEAIIQSGDYQSMTDEQREDALKAAYEYANEIGKEAALPGDYSRRISKYLNGLDDEKAVADAIVRHVLGAAPSKQEQMTAAGVSASTAAYVENLLDGIKPETGRSSVRTVQKWEALVDSDELSDSDVEKLLPLYMTGKTPERYKNALDEGFTSEEFVDAYRIYLDREEGTKKTQLIRQMSAELGVPYREAKQLYEIYTEDIA